uniref:Uncharacterized protein n=1 Tax=Meloidogyne enterolobii TaxID=390850 RepID=A0A6V7W182_MELEN|nr:unnamed protein product [Meloidogyne enterolobii]
MEDIVMKEKYYLISKFSAQSKDVYGCGLVYPPNNKTDEHPYAFFTQNGKILGKHLNY